MSHDVDAVVILTATIQPADVIYCDRNLVSQRLGDYLHAFRFWLGERLIRKLIFVENSGFDLEVFKKEVSRNHRALNKEVELLSFKQAYFDRNLSKSYGEMPIMKYTLEYSMIAPQCAHVIKATGRYMPTNFYKVWRQIGTLKEIDVMANFYQLPRVADSRFFLARPSFLYDYLFPSLEKVNDSEGYYFEHALADAIQNAITSGRRWRPWPGGGFLVDGVQGSTNTVYAYPHWKRYAYRAIATLRNGVPFQWRLGAPEARHRSKPR